MTENCTHMHIPQARFETAIPVFLERSSTVSSLDHVIEVESVTGYYSCVRVEHWTLQSTGVRIQLPINLV